MVVVGIALFNSVLLSVDPIEPPLTFLVVRLHVPILLKGSIIYVDLIVYNICPYYSSGQNV